MEGIRNSVTAIVPTHNDSSKLERTIKSLIDPINLCVGEIIVIDDNSDKDNASNIRWVCQDFGVKLITNEINYGLAGSRNKGIEQAKYNWIFPLDTGDYAYPQGIDELYIEALLDDQQHDVYYGDITDKYDKDHPLHNIAKPVQHITKESFAKENPLFCSSLISKQAWVKSGGYTMREYSHYEDYGLNIKMFNAGARFKYCDVLVYHHDYNPDSMLSKLHKHTDYFKRLARWEFDRNEIFYDI